jgi:hypothetical protein
MLEQLEVDLASHLIRLSDEELVHAVYEAVEAVVDDDDGGLYKWDFMYRHLAEVFERFAPEAEWADRMRDLREDCADHDDGDMLADEIEASREVRRARAGARILAREFPEQLKS